MVRLKVKDAADHIGKLLFQFLYGAIKRRFYESNERFENSFQFLYGAIKRYYVEQPLDFINISIPIWCD